MRRFARDSKHWPKAFWAAMAATAIGLATTATPVLADSLGWWWH